MPAACPHRCPAAAAHVCRHSLTTPLTPLPTASALPGGVSRCLSQLYSPHHPACCVAPAPQLEMEDGARLLLLLLAYGHRTGGAARGRHSQRACFPPPPNGQVM